MSTISIRSLARTAALATLAIGFASSIAAQAPGPAPAASELELLGDAIRDPLVVREVELSAPLRIGRGELRPKPGTKSYVLAARGTVCGVWVAGPASFAYRVEDPFILPIAERNLKQLTKLSLHREPAGASIRIELQEAVIWGWDILAAEPPTPDERNGRPFSPWAKELLQRGGVDNPAFDMLLTKWNGHAGYVNARLRGAKEDFVLDVDPRPHVREEWLARLPKGSRREDRIKNPSTIVLQPIGRQLWEPRAGSFTIAEVTSGIVNDRGPHVVSKARMRIVAETSGLSLLAFRTSDQIMTPAGKQVPVRVRSVSVDGRPAAHRFRRGFLLVVLPRPLETGAEVFVESEIEGDFLERNEGDLYWWLSGSAIAPRPADNGELRATFDLTVEAPGPFVQFASGATLEWVQGAVSRLRSRVGQPVSELPVISAGMYRSVVEVVRGYRVVVSTYSGMSDPDARRIGLAFFAAKECLEDELGVPYPFVETDFLEVELSQVSWRMPGLFQYPRQIFDTAAPPGRPAPEETITPVVAESFLAHVAPVRDSGDGWLPSSLGMYLAAVCLQRAEQDQDAGRERFAQALRSWQADARKIRGAASVYLAEYLALEDKDDWHDYASLRFYRGALVVHAIRRELHAMRGGETEGDELFHAVLHELASSFTRKSTATYDLLAILNRITGRDWHPFFERFVYGTETPEAN